MPTFAAVDVGSNSVRLKIARLQAGRLRSLHEDREVTRLGEGVFGSGFLTPESMAETVNQLHHPTHSFELRSMLGNDGTNSHSRGRPGYEFILVSRECHTRTRKLRYSLSLWP